MPASVSQTPIRSAFTSTASPSKAFASAVSAGDVLWCATWQYSQSNTCTGVGDTVNGANSWTMAGGGPINSAGFGNARLYIWYRLNSGAGTPTVTATWTGSAQGQIAIASATGYAGGGMLDQFVSFGGNSTYVNFTGPTGQGYEATTGPTGTLAQAIEVAFGFYTGDAGYGDQTSQGYTTYAMSDYVYSACFTKVTAATTALSLITGQGAISPQNIALITFKNVGSPGPVLSAPSATPGSTTASVGATTDTASGTLYALARIAGSAASAATIKATGQSVAVSTTTPSFTYTGLTASTANYYVDCVQNATAGDSNVVTAGPFTTSGAAATAVTMSGPSGGVTGVASTNFTVGANGVISGTVTVTPSSGSGGGTFTPTSVNISSGTPTATFTYTPASVGAKTISVTNSGGLTNPSNITYTATAAPSVPTVTTDALRDQTNAVRASHLVAKIVATRLSDLAQICTWTNQTTSAGGVLTLTNASLTAVPHIITTASADGTAAGAKVYTPAV